MAKKATAKTKVSVNKRPVKAGSTHNQHGGFPTQKVILIRGKILSDLNKKKNG